jgi:hypothetical protein
VPVQGRAGQGRAEDRAGQDRAVRYPVSQFRRAWKTHHREELREQPLVLILRIVRAREGGSACTLILLRGRRTPE